VTSARVVPLDADVHAQVQALLPWYVRARLEADERAIVDAHVAQCTRCQGELAWERKLLVARDDETGDLRDVDSDLAMLRARIAGAADPSTRGSATTRLVNAWRAGPAWMRWALLAQCVVVAWLGAALLVEVPLPGQRYRALGASAAMPAAGNLIVRFRPDATEQQMRDALRDSNARIEHGPTRTDAYLLTVPAERVGDAVVRLRAQPAVLLVESLDGAGPP
jgi:anti-sigma factor RsiW